MNKKENYNNYALFLDTSSTTDKAFQFSDDLTDSAGKHRRRRSVNGKPRHDQRYVETIVVVDDAMIRAHGGQNVTKYALTIINMVSAEYLVIQYCIFVFSCIFVCIFHDGSHSQ